jgi:hypothetical protein
MPNKLSGETRVAKFQFFSGLWPPAKGGADDDEITGNDRRRNMDYKSKTLWNTYLLIE